MKHRGGHHGGSWKVAYADFVTAMMALFLCLWLTAQDSQIKDAVERAFRNPFSAVNKEGTGIIPSKDATAQVKAQGKFDSASAAELEMMRHITEDLAKILKGQDESDDSVKVEMVPEGLRINVFDRSHKPVFEPETDVFTSYGSWVFSTLAWEISRYETFTIELQGHTLTNSQTGREVHSKWELSAERANAARRKLVQNGVTPTQIFKVSGYADTQPMPDQPVSSEGNRRVTVLLKIQNLDDRTGATPPNYAQHH